MAHPKHTDLETHNGRIDTRELLEILDHLIYVVECIAHGIGGEAKFELDQLIWVVEGSQVLTKTEVLANLKEAKSFLGEGRYPNAVTPLTKARKVLWKEFGE